MRAERKQLRGGNSRTRSSPEHRRGGGRQHLAAIRRPSQEGDPAAPKPLQLDAVLRGHVPHLEGGTTGLGGSLDTAQPHSHRDGS